MGESLCKSKLVENKSKCQKLAKKETTTNEFTPPDPIKTTHPLNKTQLTKLANEIEQNQTNLVKQNKNPTPVQEYQGITVVMAMAKAKPKPTQSSKKASTRKIFRVLLDSGSDGDLLFHEKGTPKHFPYLTRQMPKTWHTSNGDFQTKGKSEVHLKFCEYSNSKRVLIHPDVVTCTKGDKPVFDLIIGTKTMNELGIILDLNTR